MDKIIDLLMIITLTLSATYLVYKIPDVIVNGFEHGNIIYIQSPDVDYYVQKEDKES